MDWADVAAFVQTFARRLGALTEQKDDLESAIRWYQHAADLGKGADAGLLRKISDLKIKCLERQIAAHEEFLLRHNADEVHAKKSEELKSAKTKRAEILIFSMPGVFVRLCRNCSARGKIRTRG